MTRINVGIKPKELPSKLLIAELREIIRIPNQVRKGKFVIKNQPEHFKLGSGHVKFFYNKLGYLHDRYIALRKEALERNHNVQDFSNSWDEVPKEMLGDYVETKRDRDLLIERIKDRGFNLNT